jgi:hypothetical protein
LELLAGKNGKRVQRLKKRDREKAGELAKCLPLTKEEGRRYS